MVHVFRFRLGKLCFPRSCDLIYYFSDPYYLAPECFPLDLTFKALIAASNSHLEREIIDPANAKSCVWSLGIILLELCLVR